MLMKPIEINTQYTNAKCYLRIDCYYNYNIAIQAMDISDCTPFATLTVNLSELKEPYAYLDTNNCPWVMDLFEKYNLGMWTWLTKWSGYCEYPLYELNLDRIRKFSKKNMECSNTQKGH